MARTGRPPKPVEQKRRQGTLRKDRMPVSAGNLAVVAEVLPEPADLAPADVLEQVLSSGRAWLAQTDLVAVTMLRESLEERAAVRELVLTGVGDARKALRELDKQIIGQLSLLGFDPAARSRLGLAEVKRVSKFQELQARSAAVADKSNGRRTSAG